MALDRTAQSEDCLKLNIWTAGLGGGKKRPVMLWCHGGGFTGGSGGNVRYDGAMLAKKHGVVLVTVNHRLNAFGFLYLAKLGGEKYADSGNVGMLDIVAALNWVKDNIAEFGGDPGNVTIFGQSGGGSKVTTAMAMPQAERKTRHAALYAALLRNDISGWGDRFLSALMGTKKFKLTDSAPPPRAKTEIHPLRH